LVTSAIRHLANRRLAELRKDAEALPTNERGIPQITDLMWSYSSGPLFMAAVELWMAARTDRELHAALWPIEKQLGQTSGQLLRELYAGYSDHPHFEQLMQLTVHMMRGMALQKILNDDDRQRRKALRLWDQMMTALLAPKRGIEP
jgi:hypothetical protein